MLVEANVSVIHHYVYLFSVSCLSAAPLPSFFTFKPHLTFHLSSIRPVSIYFSPLLLSLFVFLSFPLLLFSFLPPALYLSLSVFVYKPFHLDIALYVKPLYLNGVLFKTLSFK